MRKNIRVSALDLIEESYLETCLLLVWKMSRINQHPLHNISGQIALLAHDEVPSMKRLLEVFIHPLLKTKYSYWKYERETRFIAPNSGLQSISNRAIQSLTFGLKTSDEDKERVYEELKKPQWKHVLLFQAKKVEGRFALEFDKLDKQELLVCP